MYIYVCIYIYIYIYTLLPSLVFISQFLLLDFLLHYGRSRSCYPLGQSQAYHSGKWAGQPLLLKFGRENGRIDFVFFVRFHSHWVYLNNGWTLLASLCFRLFPKSFSQFLACVCHCKPSSAVDSPEGCVFLFRHANNKNMCVIFFCLAWSYLEGLGRRRHCRSWRVCWGCLCGIAIPSTEGGVR